MTVGQNAVPVGWVWVWRVNEAGVIGRHTEPVAVRGAQALADRWAIWVGSQWYIVDTRGDWFQVVERQGVGHETVTVAPPVWEEDEEEGRTVDEWEEAERRELEAEWRVGRED